MTTFAELGVPPQLAAALAKRSINEPFPIQEAAIPDLMSGRDVLGRAPTGSGKTLAFGLPVISRVGKAESRHPRALILAPTRELAEQISRELMPLGRAYKRWVLAVYGGVGYEFQRKNLRRGTDVVVATPGRLTDLIEQQAVALADVDIVVVDEADRMADMGFMPQVRELLDQTSPDRQTMLFSATLDKDVAELTRRYQRNPVRHEVAGAEEAHDAAHYFWKTATHDRVQRTAEIVESSTPSIVFTRTRRGADRLAGQLKRAGVDATAIHGGRTQGQRNRALDSFTKGRVQALVATDVAARGIHVDNVASVIHFDLPADSKDYLHRSGRTARAGESGVVVSLVGPDQMGALRKIQRAVGLDSRTHDPAEDWLTGRSGSRIGDRPITGEQPATGRRDRHGGARKPSERRGRNKNRNQTRSRTGGTTGSAGDERARGGKRKPRHASRKHTRSQRPNPR